MSYDGGMRICQIQDCDRPLLARGWCAAHYQRWQTHGDPLLGGRPKKPRRERLPCPVPECGREVKTVGLCAKHYQRLRITGTTELVRKICSLDTCETLLFREDFCRKHWARWNQFGDPLAERECSIDGCPRTAPSGKRGWCVLHYTRWIKHGDVGGVAPTFFEPPHPPGDGRQWCTTCHAELPFADFHRDKTAAHGHARMCRNCRKDLRIAESYGIDAATYRQLLDEQGHACLICRKPETATHQSGCLRRLSVDHDHKCCPGKKSCGKCVRGLLCARCNSALGLVDEDLTVIASMAAYLNRSI
jgi:hypothetical protein